MTTNHATLREVLMPSRTARSAVGLQLPLGMALLGCAPHALKLLRHLTVAVVGCGSIGGRVAVLLARMGFGGLILVDPKKYKAGSLATHEIGPAEVDRRKALVVGRRCKAISPTTRIMAFAGPVEALDLAALAGVDLAFMAPDLLTVEVELGQRCLWLGKPLAQASVHGPTLTVQVRFFLNAKGGAGACPVCCYGHTELEMMTRQARFSCEGATGAATQSPAEGAATNSLSALCSLAADLGAVQILRFLLKLGQPVADTMLEYNGFTHSTVIMPVARSPKCRLDHTTFTQKTLAAPLEDHSLAQLTLEAVGAPVSPDAQFQLAGFDWVELAACRCPQAAPVQKFVARGTKEVSLCRLCASPLVPLGFYSHRTVGAALLGSAVDTPLHKLGVRGLASALVRQGDSGVLVISQPSTPIAR